MAVSVTCTNHPHDGYITISIAPTTTYSNVGIVLIKHKIRTELLFTSVYMKYINSTSDLTFSYDDYLCRNNCTYDVCVEFMSITRLPIDSTTVQVESKFDVLVLNDGIDSWRTPLNVSAINTTLIRPYVMNSPLYASKPSYYTCTNNNYEEGTCHGVFLKIVEDGDKCSFDTSQNWKYRKELKNFLLLPCAKILKSVSGEMWIVGIKTDSITDNSLFENAEIEGARQIEFGWFEVGDADSEEDLFFNHLINVPSVLWSGV